MGLMKLPRTHKMSFGSKFGGLWKESNGRGFLFGRDPFDNLWKMHDKHLLHQKKNKECCDEHTSSADDKVNSKE